ncbi:MAG: vanadium-dependent haloperoxidase [Saprospiraceae bacterium]
MIKPVCIGFSLFFLLLLPVSCSRDKAAVQCADYQLASDVTLKWHHLLLDLERMTQGYRPPVSARMWAYTEVAAWQAALPGVPEALALDGHFEGMPAAPRFEGVFCLPASLNAAFAEIFRQFFPTAPLHLIEKIKTLESDLLDQIKPGADARGVEQSIAYGKKTALGVWRWSATDAIGHEGFLYNHDRGYVPPACAGCWQPGGDHPMPALLPNWGGVRAFVVPPMSVKLNPPLIHDDTPGSPFHAQAMELYTMSKPLTNEYRWIAEFWSDDVAGLTISPTGRWVSIVNQSLEQANLPLPQVLELYLKAALASSDAFLTCWKGKYQFNLERPEAYIRRVVDPNWRPLHDSPNFPAYPSGHATVGAAVSEVLGVFLGESFALTDRTHEGRTEFEGKPRSFRSFRQMAEENALSRLALGVHFRMDCDEGLRIGRLISKRVLALPVRKQEARISLKKVNP